MFTCSEHAGALLLLAMVVENKIWTRTASWKRKFKALAETEGSIARRYTGGRVEANHERGGLVGGGEFEGFSEGLKAPKYRTVRLFLFD